MGLGSSVEAKGVLVLASSRASGAWVLPVLVLHPGPPFQGPEAADLGHEKGVNTGCPLCYSTLHPFRQTLCVLPAISGSR